MTTRCLRASVAFLLFGLLPGLVTPAASARATKSPQIHFLNPSSGYYPGSDPTGSSTAPAVSDRADGADGFYRLVAWAADVSPGTRVVAGLRIGDSETSIGEMARSRTLGDTYELLWDIPDDLAAGDATLIVKLVHPDGPSISHDEVDVRLRHQPTGSTATTNPGPDQAVGVTWPKQGGSLGFYRRPGGPWTTVLDAVTSEGTQQIRAFYSVSLPGAPPEFVFCGTLDTQPQVEPFGFQMGCELAAETKPKQVTAVGMVAEGTYEEGGQTQGLGLTQESADVVRTAGVVQSPRDMTLSVAPYGRALVNQCAGLLVSVTDSQGRPVQGANVDAHLHGPEGSGFASGPQSSSSKAPDAGKHEVTPTVNCSGTAAGEQGTHAGAEGEQPVFHRESTDGSGLSGPDGVAPGVWRFDAFSTSPGTATVTVWLDEARSGSGTDNDVMGSDEVKAVSHLQWLTVAPSLRIDALTRSATTADGCIPFLARVKAGDEPVPAINVDLTAAGPGDGVAFCMPEGGDEVWKPDPPPPQEGTGAAPEGGPQVRGLEGLTDERGNLMFGLTSSRRGETAVTAWLDGELGADDDVQVTTEPQATNSITWAADRADVKLGFLNPSPYGPASPGDGSGTQIPEGETISVALTASVPDFVQQLVLYVSSDEGLNFFQIGFPERVPGTDVFQTEWDVDLPRGAHILRAEAPGSNVVADLRITVGPPLPAGPPAPVVDGSLVTPLESVEIADPNVGSPTQFMEGVTSVSGSASAGAEGVDFFYTTVPAGISPEETDWKYCGYADLDGAGNSPQPFEEPCTLAEGEFLANVTALAALAVDCTTIAGCNASPDDGGTGTRPIVKDAGDAVRIYPRDAAPTLSIHLPRKKGEVGTCHPVNVFVSDFAGENVPNGSVDLRIEGSGVRVCGGIGGSRSSLGPGHVRIPTLLDGSASVDILSHKAGRSSIVAWLDEDGDGSRDATEADVSASFRWRPRSNSG